MKVSLNWLRDYVKIPAKYSARELGNLLTLHTAEVEEVVEQNKGFDKMVVGKVLKLKKHPDADKLKLAITDIGKKDPVQIVCGGVNLEEGMIVPIALPGAYVKWHGEGDPVKLEEAKIRGEKSYGMICAGEEIGLPPCPPEEITELHIKAKPGTPLAKALNLTDTVMEIDNKSLTHRPDLWGHYGIAREVAALVGSKLEKITPKTTAKTTNKPDKNLSVEIKNPDLCPRYIGVRISGIKIEESPEWLQQKLRAAGHATYNNIVDITNFISSELGQPMHAFDSRYINGGIIVRTAKKGEKMKTLDDKERKLTNKMLLICDHKKPVALAGIMGGQDSEIQDDTTEIIFEAANFDAPCVRKTSAALGLRTESVQRFEKSLDPALPELAIQRAIELTLKLCPSAKLTSPIVDINHAKPKKLTIKTTKDRICSKIGVNIPETQIIKILKSLEFDVKKDKEPTNNRFAKQNTTNRKLPTASCQLTITVPSFRATKDVEGEDDIIEEVARMYGYDNIPSQLPQLPTKLPEENRERFLKHKTRDIISLGLGFTETSNYSFYSEEDFQKANLDEKDHIKLLNYLSQDQTHLRVSLLPNMLKALHTALKHEDTPKLYEIGHTYHETSKFMPLEEKWIIAVVTGEDAFKHAKGAAETYLDKFGADNAKIIPTHNSQLTTHNSLADITVRGQKVGHLYEVHPEVLKKFDIELPVAAFEVNFTRLVSLSLRQHKYIQIPKFPSLQFDVSVTLPEKITAEKALQSIRRSHKALIKDVKLFDIYRGEGLKEGTKALAYRITLRADDRTLNDQEMAEVQKKVFANLEGLGGKIRGK